MKPKMSINKMLMVPHVISVQDWNPRGPGLGKHWDGAELMPDTQQHQGTEGAGEKRLELLSSAL